MSCDPNTTRKETVEEITVQVIFELNLIYGLVVNFADRKQNIFPSTHKIIVILLILQAINKTATVTYVPRTNLKGIKKITVIECKTSR